MKKYRNLVFYTSIIGLFSALIYFIVRVGRHNLEAKQNVYGLASTTSAWNDFIHHLTEDFGAPVAILLLQIVVILLAVRIFGWICQKIGQPTVVGEIFAGVVLGPSLLGHYFPQVSEFLFPVSSLENIRFLSQIGLILFMFIVGMELNLKTLKNRANNALIISHTSIAVCFTLGVLVAYYLFGNFTHQSTIFLPFALFMGIAMSIAAFPVMARIIHERGINKTPLGATIITCAAIDDITAWCLLAAVIAVVKAGSFASSLFIILLALLYVLAMFKIVRPFLKRIADLQSSNRTISKSVIGVFFLILFLSAYATEVIGIHALFGAFLAGVIMPPNLNFRNLFTEKIEDVSLVLLLPLFFVFTGLRTEIGLLNEPGLWMICGGIVFLAIFGKTMGSAIAARFVGNNWKDSLTIGALMNTRGLMELVVLNIGLDLGILTPEVFAMMVVMALTTTFMTSPLLSIIDKV
ncbi:cation:proton antiporter, partial [Dysgonomonas gadei]